MSKKTKTKEKLTDAEIVANELFPVLEKLERQGFSADYIGYVMVMMGGKAIKDILGKEHLSSLFDHIKDDHELQRND